MTPIIKDTITENPARAKFIPAHPASAEDRVSLNPIDFEDAVRALLRTRPTWDDEEAAR